MHDVGTSPDALVGLDVPSQEDDVHGQRWLAACREATATATLDWSLGGAAMDAQPGGAGAPCMHAVLRIGQVGEVLAALERQRIRQPRERLAAEPPWRDLDLIFPSTVGTPMDPRNVNRRFDKVRSDAVSNGRGFTICASAVRRSS
jgi:hypothetical protein